MRLWGKTKAGQDVHAVTLTNKNNMEIVVLTLGATVQSIVMADAEGVRRDIVLGYDTAAEYEDGGCFIGTVVGRNSNRIGGAKLMIDGVEVLLEKNDGENNLHSGKNGLSLRIWDVAEEKPSSVKMTIVSPEEEMGFPGNMNVSVTYTLHDENVLDIHYEAVCDKTTVANFTNHTYFNLDGHDSGDVMDQMMTLFAESYTPIVDSAAIPTGEIASVEDTPMDLRVMKPIGESIDDDFEQLTFVGGYDHNFVLAYDGDGTMELAARAMSRKTGIMVECYTDCPGIQFYAGNSLPPHKGKGGVNYGKRHGFCLETQFYPDSANKPNFPQPILKAGEKYSSHTEYHFHVNR